MIEISTMIISLIITELFADKIDLLQLLMILTSLDVSQIRQNGSLMKTFIRIVIMLTKVAYSI